MVKRHYFCYTIQSFVRRETKYFCMVFEDKVTFICFHFFEFHIVFTMALNS